MIAVTDLVALSRPAPSMELNATITPAKINIVNDIMVNITPARAAFFPANLLATITNANTRMIP